MPERRLKWKSKQIREQIEVIEGKKSPSLLLKNARFLHAKLKQWVNGHIWIYQDRIVYVGNELPSNLESTEVVDCQSYVLVPGYIEPHAHPFQLYNPQSLARYASQTGTTTLINDNLMLFLLSGKKKAFSLLEELKQLPVSMYWWCRFDPQTVLQEEDQVFNHHDIKSWLEHDLVLQGGELTGWPRLLAGDDLMLLWLQEAKRLRKRIEGHFPGASETTLAKMMLFGADADHEAMTGEDVWKRLMQGYTVSLRYSSIRPDLPKLLEEMKKYPIEDYSSIMFTTDGSTPIFYEQGLLDKMIAIAIEHGVDPMDAYLMASYNVARYYGIDHWYGMIATGRIAHINFLESEELPTPVHVLAKGHWVKRNGAPCGEWPDLEWQNIGLKELSLDWELSYDDLHFSMPFGIEMVNSVITKPYSISLDATGDELSMEHDESFLMLVDRHGKWHVNTLVKGFATSVSGFVSSYSNSGDLIILGKRKEDMLLAFNRMKEMGGGIVLAEHGKIVHEISLPLGGVMSDQRMEEVIQQTKQLVKLLKERGYQHEDPIYNLLFFSSTHLPYIRVTPMGMYDVMKKTVLFPSIMR
ncbi:adenine deaminase C-terminal domain-containing protein [Aeribacillus pallidus]|uniref:adenine deaminase C-terminal domain-containing protein n=1 Tax=Aeribacillus pallidus TaxID=33936 RepID=UPI003D1B159C